MIPPRVVPPHTRGSTVGWALAQQIDHGSPAHAGIDLVDRGGGRGERRFPRTRGDRPSGKTTLARALAVPPHTRVSTLSVSTAPILNEFFRAPLGKTFYERVAALQTALDAWRAHYTTERMHLGHRVMGADLSRQ